MQLETIIALIVIIPVILFPAAFVWYLNIGALWAMWQATRAKERKVRFAKLNF